MAKKNYYAVKQGKVPGIYRTWDACKAQVHGYPGAIYKGFERLEEAEAFLGGGKMLEPLLRETIGTYFAAPERKAVQSTAAPDPSSWDWEHLILAEKPCEDPEYAGVGRSAVAYVDGSYQHALGKFSCGVVLFLDGKELNLAEDYSDPDLVSMRNVAGEIKGAELAMAYCLTHDIPELAIYHDYQGIASWCTREWQAKKQGTIDYRNFYDLASAKVAIRFCKVKGHTGVTYNEKADQLAKQAGGISTLEDKALGCTQKCGKAYVDGVMGYGDRLKVKGLNLLSAPGNDLVAATALASCGCHMVLFTTGRGTPFGTFVPTMKISTNSTLAKNKPGWIDFNAGVIVENEPMEKTCERFIDYIIRVASGEPVNNEKKNYREIAIFKTGVTL